MKIVLTLLISTLGCGLYAQDPKTKGATTVPGNSYIYVDSDGKTKMGTRTPFGVSVKEVDKDAAKNGARKADPSKPLVPATPPGKSMVKAEEKGDTVVFRRQTPFGESVWQRKKSELSDFEKQVLEGQKPASGKN